MFEMGAKLEEFLLDKKEKMVIVKEIKAKNEHQLVFKFEKRKGKPTTLVGRFYLEDREKKELLSLLKKRLSCGGSIENEWFVLQGECKQRVVEVLTNEQWKFKK